MVRRLPPTPHHLQPPPSILRRLVHGLQEPVLVHVKTARAREEEPAVLHEEQPDGVHLAVPTQRAARGLSRLRERRRVQHDHVDDATWVIQLEDSRASNIVAHIEEKYGIKPGESTPDGRLYLKPEEECLAACCGAPMMMVDHVYYEKLTTEKVDEILDGLE